MSDRTPNPATPLELGLDTFGDVTVDAEGRLLSQARVLRDVVAEAELADRAGVDFFGVGEHHRPDFAISATTRSASTSASPPSTPSPAAAPR